MHLELDAFTALVIILCFLGLILKETVMGGNSSKESHSHKRHVTSPSSSSSYGSVGSSSSSDIHDYGYPQPQSSYPYTQPQHKPYQRPNYQRNNIQANLHDYSRPNRKLDRRYSRIADDYHSLDEVTTALSHAGLESSNLIVGIDFTKSNEWTGRRSFNRKSLHHIGNSQNPYEQAISIIGKTLTSFDEDNMIPCFGFGDASTHDQDVFSFHSDERFCNGFEEVLSRYREIVPCLRLAGPTSFAPIIEMAMTIVEKSGGQYHVLLIIADGQVTRSVDTENGKPSSQEKKTIDAIVKASEYPLSIVLVGVGDGPWDMMREFDDNIPARAFDNFQFVNFTEIMSKNVDSNRKETEFALAALMEIPSQYKATIDHNLLGTRRGHSPDRVPLPPPQYDRASSINGAAYIRSNSFQQGAAYIRSNSFQQSTHRNASNNNEMNTEPNTEPSSSGLYDNKLCPICLTNTKDMAFGCGHQTCCECGESLELCPICRSTIDTRIKLY